MKVEIFALLQLPEIPLLLIDPLVAWPQAPTPGAEKYFGNGKPSCHLTVDGSIAGLHNFALRLGLRRAWFQASPPASWPHYDLTPPKRALALQVGALAMDPAALVPREHAWRANAHASKGAPSEPWTCACSDCAEVRELGGFARTEELWKDAVRAARRNMPEGTRHRLVAALEDAHAALQQDGAAVRDTGLTVLRAALQMATKVSTYDPGISARTQEAMLFGNARDLAEKWVEGISTVHRLALPEERVEILRDVLRACYPMKVARAPKRGAK